MTDDLAELRRAFTLYPRGVMAVAAQIDGAPVGLAVSAFVSVSLDPPLLALCIDAASRTWPVLSTADTIGVSVLTEEHAWLGRQLASRSRDRFAGATFDQTSRGALLLDGAAARFECRTETVVPGGDHLIVLLRVLSMAADPTRAPLIWHDSEFRAVAPLTPGGAASDRPAASGDARRAGSSRSAAR
ncbi:flavin reductase family protein [Paractinoplanes durhamensis]|uniref:Oxidoreductase n=1 Tax=Paractinoplanes durhamensis TaxID=113563 RepID=A0ABQ3YVK2_9ACTN|nr:flavin reductase family protein [Actinoplanes durhamensis]GIE01552.1 putative oxidoreductase [Actinoplanes durhamensis]